MLAVLLLASLAGCGGGLASRLPPGEDVMRSELVFGRAKADGSTVTDAQWRAFVDEHVTPRFPDGLTVVDASGQWRDRTGVVIREASKLVLILHPADENSRRAIEEIRTLYRKLFDQESVLLMSTFSRVSF